MLASLLPLLVSVASGVVPPPASTLWPSAPEARANRKEVQYVGGAPVVLIEPTEVDIGGMSDVITSAPFVVRSAAAERIISGRPSWVGNMVVLYRADGSKCDAKVARLANYGWFEVIEGDTTAAPTTAWLWEHSNARGSTYLVAELSDGRCQDAVFAELAAVAASRVVAPDDATPSEQHTALVAAAKLPAFQYRQNLFVRANYAATADYGAPSRAATEPWDAAPVVLAYQVGDRRILAVRMAADGSCGEFGADLFAAWEVLQRDGTQFLAQRYESTQGENPLLLFGVGVGVGDAATFQFADQPTFYVPNDLGETCGC